MFFYIECTEGEVKTKLLNGTELMTWDVAKEGQDTVHRLNTYEKSIGGAKRYRLRRDVSGNEEQNAEWRSKVRGLFASGERRAPPWNPENWWQKMLAGPCKDHYPYMSRQHPGFLAYYPTPEHGAIGRPVFCTVGKYLAKYCKPYLNDHAIQTYSARCVAEASNYQLSFAKTAEDMLYVYKNGPPSCMSHEEDHYRLPVHPITIYAAGDLELAFLHGPGGVAARALCWPERKIFGRVYPVDNSAAMVDLASRLHARGWRAIPVGSNGFTGARLQRVPLTGDALSLWKARFSVDCDGAFVCPHTDHEHFVKDNGINLIIDHSGDILSADYGQGGAHYKNCQIPGCTNKGYVSRGGARHSGAYNTDRSFMCSPCLETLLRCAVCGLYAKSERLIGLVLRDFIPGHYAREEQPYCYACVDQHTSLCACCKQQLVVAGWSKAGYRPPRSSARPHYCFLCREDNKVVQCGSCGYWHEATKKCLCQGSRFDYVETADVAPAAVQE